ncbi:cytochrome b/b6 domain-containing protein [Hymenobacter persicinus]|uniref:Cytochrome b/b6 domain-containing protein n=1 Tax=Hymenobacter persicinus TaxID=2025506 RepID=A0A4Q5LB20_9BACT|nr:cytochrome b/b6 domain-containing protein [Hymenobacter persicinus]RYU79294.1 cytochrome b/b6 domain-containing protein [Hymenobacter persicinus]
MQAHSTPVAEAPVGKKNSLALRLWHWGSAAVISGLLTTILFLKVILKTKSLGPEFQGLLQKDGLVLSQQQARGLTHAIAERIWDWHIYLGLTLTFLLLFRIVLEFFQRGRQRFSVKLSTARQYFRQQGADLQDARHSLAVKYSYLVFYLMLVVMVVTGLMLTYADDVEALHKLEHTVKEVHNVNMYLILTFIVLHIGGVVWSEQTKGKGIVSDMINGGQ